VRVFIFLASLYLFVLSLELIKSGARDLAALAGLHEAGGRASFAGSTGAFGLGWLLACLFLSGSPVAALSLGLLQADTVSVEESYAMVMGSRIGASFVVLAIGFAYDLRFRAVKGGVYVGALALMTTAAVYLPAWGLGYGVLASGWLDGLRFGRPETVASVIDLAFGPVVALAGALPPWAVALAGIGCLLGAFQLFDRALPPVDPTGGRLGAMATTIFRPSVAFFFGMVLTAITLSVSVSLTLLVPLTVRGVVRRENLIPFILGANITTFIDTLLASLMVDHPAAFSVVLCAFLVVTVVSLPIVFFAYRPFERALDAAAVWVTRRRWRLGLFLVLLFGIPVLLIFLHYPS
jgi:Na+/phosphate symporter